jgi:hypothetical protein
MKDKLFPVGCNELLDFVRPDHPFSPEPPPLILLSNAPTAAWRFTSSKEELKFLCKAQSIQDQSASKRNFVPLRICEG